MLCKVTWSWMYLPDGRESHTEIIDLPESTSACALDAIVARFKGVWGAPWETIAIDRLVSGHYVANPDARSCGPFRWNTKLWIDDAAS